MNNIMQINPNTFAALGNISRCTTLKSEINLFSTMLGSTHAKGFLLENMYFPSVSKPLKYGQAVFPGILMRKKGL